MKPFTFFAIILFLLAAVVTAPARAQNPVSASVSKEGKVSFRIREDAFTIYLSDAGQLLDYHINGKGRIDYDLNGRLRSVGQVGIDYDLDGCIRKIGNVSISYDLSNRIREVGSLHISYNLNDKITQIGETRICYDLNGRVSSIDG